MPTISEAAHMIALAYHASNVNGVATLGNGFSAPNGWHIVDFIDHSSSGGDTAAIFQSNNGSQIFIAGRGTVSGGGNLLVDTSIDIGLAPFSRISDAESILAQVRSNFLGAQITAGGHSLAGEVWASVSEAQPLGTPLEVLALNAPNSAIASNFDNHVLQINSRLDAIGHWGADYHNFITLDTNISWAPFNQLGDHGTHSVNNLVEGIDLNGAIANTQLGQLVNISAAVEVFGRVTEYQLPGLRGNVFNETTSVDINPDGSYTEVITRTFLSGGVRDVVTINFQANNTGTVTTTDGTGRVLSTETLTTNPVDHSQVVVRKFYDATGQVQSEGTFSIGPDGQARLHVSGTGLFVAHVVNTTVTLAPGAEASITGSNNRIVVGENAKLLGDLTQTSVDVGGWNSNIAVTLTDSTLTTLQVHRAVGIPGVEALDLELFGTNNQVILTSGVTLRDHSSLSTIVALTGSQLMELGHNNNLILRPGSSTTIVGTNNAVLGSYGEATVDNLGGAGNVNWSSTNLDPNISVDFFTSDGFHATINDQGIIAPISGGFNGGFINGIEVTPDPDADPHYGGGGPLPDPLINGVSFQAFGDIIVIAADGNNTIQSGVANSRIVAGDGNNVITVDQGTSTTISLGDGDIRGRESLLATNEPALRHTETQWGQTCVLTCGNGNRYPSRHGLRTGSLCLPLRLHRHIHQCR